MMKNSARNHVSVIRMIPDQRGTMSNTCQDHVIINSRDPICHSTCLTAEPLEQVEAVAMEAEELTEVATD
jgi:hypothetical protein